MCFLTYEEGIDGPTIYSWPASLVPIVGKGIVVDL